MLPALQAELTEKNELEYSDSTKLILSNVILKIRWCGVCEVVVTIFSIGSLTVANLCN